MTIKKAKILDDILRRFNGNVTVYWDKLQKELSDRDGNPTREYFITENNIKYLLGDGVLQKDHRTTGDALMLTDKGFSILTDLAELGYVTKAKRQRRKSLAAGLVLSSTLIILAITIIQFIFNFPTTKNNPYPDTQYNQSIQQSTEQSDNHTPIAKPDSLNADTPKYQQPTLKETDKP